MKRRLPPGVWLALRLLTGIVLLALLLHSLNLQALIRQLHHVDWPWMGVAFVSLVAGILLSALRWQIVLDMLGVQRSYGELLLRYWSGSFYNAVLPGSIGGDVVRAGGLARSGIPLATTVMSVFVDRAIGLWVNILMGLLSSLWPLPAPYRGTLGLLFGAVGGGGLLIVLLAPVLWRYLPRRLQRLVELGPLLRERWRWSVLGYTALFQVCVVLHPYAIGLALHTPISMRIWSLYMPAVVLATLLPISLNGIGIREGALVVLLAGIGVSAETAALLGVLIYVTSVLSTLPGGFVPVNVDPRPATNDRRQPNADLQP